jgi:hypothetical protein
MSLTTFVRPRSCRATRDLRSKSVRATLSVDLLSPVVLRSSSWASPSGLCSKQLMMRRSTLESVTTSATESLVAPGESSGCATYCSRRATRLRSRRTKSESALTIRTSEATTAEVMAISTTCCASGKTASHVQAAIASTTTARTTSIKSTRMFVLVFDGKLNRRAQSSRELFFFGELPGTVSLYHEPAHLRLYRHFIPGKRHAEV